MKIRPLRFQLNRVATMASFFVGIGCSGEPTPGDGMGNTGGMGMGTGGAASGSGGMQIQGGTPSTFGGTPGVAGTPAAPGGMTGVSGSTTFGGAAGTPSTVAGSAGTPGAGGSNTGSAGTPGAGGSAGTPGAGGSNTGSAGTPGAGGSAGTPPMGGAGGAVVHPPLDCGPKGWAVENNGPPKNRVNYVILGDGYTASTVETTLKSHIDVANRRRFEHESGEPYGRYRKFVNICVMKAVSQNDGIGNGPTAFDGGNGGDRLASVNQNKVNDYIKANVPASFEVDWKAVVLNQNRWENTGSILMLWSGAHADAAGAALHEGGHGFHQLADEYGSTTGCPSSNPPPSCSGSGTVHAEVNSAGNCTTTDNKWNLWLGTTQKGLKVPDMGATGPQATWLGSRYVGSGQYRPSCNSMMNSLFGERLNTSFNSVSREQMIFSIWRAVTPIDSTEPPAGAVNNPATLKVNVIDPAVINVDWTVNGTTMTNAGPTFSTASLPSGTHMISAKAYDNATEDLVRLRTGMCPSSVTGRYCHGTSWTRSTQTVSWTVTKP